MICQDYDAIDVRSMVDTEVLMVLYSLICYQQSTHLESNFEKLLNLGSFLYSHEMCLLDRKSAARGQVAYSKRYRPNYADESRSPLQFSLASARR